MFLYFLIFFISFLFALLSQITKKNKVLFYFFSFLAILVPAIFAGLRAKGIGTDTNGYIDFIFRNCSNITNFRDFFTYFQNSQVEFMFVFIDFIITRFTDSVNYSYFIFEFIILILIYMACFRFDENKYYFSYFLFLILFFNRSLNMCRQTIAIAIVLYNFKNVQDKKIIKYIFGIVVAMLFHKTALIGIIIYPMYIYFLKNNKKNVFSKILIIFSIALGICFLKSIMLMLNNFRVLDDKYILYLKAEKSTVSEFEIVFKLVIVMVSILTYKIFSKKSIENDFLTYNFIIGCLITLIGINISFGQRIAYYFTYFIIFYFNNFEKTFKGKKQQILIEALIIIVSMCYSYIGFDLLGWDETVPYKLFF